MKTPHYRWLTAATLLALSVGIASAQAPDQAPPAGQSEARPHRGGPERELQTLTRVLTLTPEQQTGVKAVLDQQMTQMRALRAGAQSGAASGAAASDTPEARQARFQQMEQIRDESDTKIAALLDDNQKKLFAGWTARRKAEMEHHRHGDGPAPDGAAAPPPPRQQ